jgi:hypothetical protein
MQQGWATVPDGRRDMRLSLLMQQDMEAKGSQKSSGFSLAFLMNKVPTWEILQKHQRHGPSICMFC